MKSPGAGVVAEPVSLLAKSQDAGRMRDMYVLGLKYKNAQCRRIWNDFAAEDPAMARLIVKDVQNDRRVSAAANETLDGYLLEAERLVVKGRKQGKVTKSRKKPVASVPGELDAVLAIEDPARREVAYAALVASRG